MLCFMFRFPAYHDGSAIFTGMLGRAVLLELALQRAHGMFGIFKLSIQLQVSGAKGAHSHRPRAL